MHFHLETILTLGVLGNLAATLAKWVLKSPKDAAKVDSLHAKLDDILSLLGKVAK